MAMKKLIFLLVMALMLSPVHAGAMKVTVNSIAPQPVDVGNDFTLSVTYTNTGSDYNYGTKAAVDLRYPFTLRTSTEPLDMGFDLCGLCSRMNNYFISVDSSAKSGTYPIYLRTGTDLSSMTTINVTVSGTPNIALFAEPVTNATPSTKFSLKINVTNIGRGVAKEITVVSKSSDFVALGSSLMTVDSVESQKSKDIIFQLTSKPDLDAGAYNLPFEVTYFDQLGTTYTSTQNIGVQIVNSGLLSIQNIKIAASTGGQPVAGMPATVVVRLQNVGHGDVDYIESTITCDGQTVKSFLGQLKRDEDAPAVFEITMPGSGKYQCSVETLYTDDLGKHTLTSSFDINVKNPDFPVIVPIIIIAIAGFYFYRKRKKK